MCYCKMKNQIYSGPALKELSKQLSLFAFIERPFVEKQREVTARFISKQILLFALNQMYFVRSKQQ